MAAIPFHADIDLFGNQLLNTVLHRAATASPPPTSGTVSGGMMFYDTTLDIAKYYDGANSKWQPFVHFMPLTTLATTPASDDYLLVYDASDTSYKKIAYANLVTGSGTDEMVATVNGAAASYLGTNGTNGVLRRLSNGGLGMSHTSQTPPDPSYLSVFIDFTNISDGTSSPGLTSTDWLMFAQSAGTTPFKVSIATFRNFIQVSLGTNFEAIATITTHVLELDSQTANKAFMSPNGSAGPPTFRQILSPDLPIIPVTKGGIGSDLSSTLAAGSILYGENNAGYIALGIGASGTILSSTGTAPQWSTVASLLPSNIQYGASFTINNTTDWSGVGPFTLTINNTGGTKNHSLGAGSNFDIIFLKGSSAPYELSMVPYTVNDGTIVITSHAKIAGKLLVRRFA
ncbi:MAG: hypothetical protein KA053_08950 [Lentimicrobiaceae bacterium]|nr:hypothetical protein [Lentimicrobiaceae bacterium]